MLVMKSLGIILFCFVSCLYAENGYVSVTHANATINVGSAPLNDSVSYEKHVVNSSIPLEISCKLEASVQSNVQVKWFKRVISYTDDKLEEKDGEIKDKNITQSYNNSTRNATLTFNSPDEKSMGKYKCEFQDGEEKYFGFPEVRSLPLVEKFEKPKRVIEGDRMKIQCKTAGYPAPTSVYWVKDNCTLNDCINYPWRSEVNFTKNADRVENATLEISNLLFTDDGYYYCVVVDEKENYIDIAAIRVNVKNRLAALWPFIGILVEVAVLVTAILLYEKKRSSNKKPAKEQEMNGLTDPETHNLQDAKEDNGGDEIRNRAVKT